MATVFRFHKVDDTWGAKATFMSQEDADKAVGQTVSVKSRRGEVRQVRLVKAIKTAVQVTFEVVEL